MLSWRYALLSCCQSTALIFCSPFVLHQLYFQRKVSVGSQHRAKTWWTAMSCGTLRGWSLLTAWEEYLNVSSMLSLPFRSKPQTWAAFKPPVRTEGPGLRAANLWVFVSSLTMLWAPFLCHPHSLKWNESYAWTHSFHGPREWTRVRLRSVVYDLTRRYLLIIRARVLYSHVDVSSSWDHTE